MNKLSLFSGIGGDDLASEWAGIRTVCFVEKDEFCQQVLKRHWPNVPIIGDVRDVTKESITAYTKRVGWTQGTGESLQHKEQKAVRQNIGNICTEKQLPEIDIISGGFPCQPHSVAGKRKGSSDERDLWPEFRRIISEIKPRWVVAENVPGLFSTEDGRFFGGILTDLASLGYAIGWCTFGAVDVGALHRRNRVFIVAYTNQPGLERRNGRILQERAGERSAGAICSSCTGCQQIKWKSGRCTVGGEIWQSEPDVGRVASRISRRVDRLRALGNAVVPQQIYPIYKAIVEIENERSLNLV
jgi:DNA (cytosine-5)-methyltransferase 1